MALVPETKAVNNSENKDDESFGHASPSGQKDPDDSFPLPERLEGNIGLFSVDNMELNMELKQELPND